MEGKALGILEATYPDNWKEVYDMWYNRKWIIAKDAMQRTGLECNTFFKLIKDF